jgi:hypothetical protein
MKDDEKNRESPMTQKECKRIIMGKHPDIKLPKLPEVIFSHAKFFYQYLFITCFYEIKNISSLLMSGKWIASLKKIISAKILNLTLRTEELTSLEEIL